MGAEKSWESIKPYIAIFAALLLWLISFVFFIVGFSFENTMMFMGFNVAKAIAIAISLVNTFIQITWNDKREDVMEWIMWAGSYIVGIASNVYSLSMILNMTDPMLERALAVGLGAMIEIAPEKVLLKGLRSLKASGGFKVPNFNKHNNNKGNNQQGKQNQPYIAPKSDYKAQYRPQNVQQVVRSLQQSNNQQKNGNGQKPQNMAAMFNMMEEEDE